MEPIERANAFSLYLHSKFIDFSVFLGCVPLSVDIHHHPVVRGRSGMIGIYLLGKIGTETRLENQLRVELIQISIGKEVLRNW